jgi:hypothetical protein
VYRAFMEMQEVKRPLGKPRCRWQDDIKMDHGEL